MITDGWMDGDCFMTLLTIMSYARFWAFVLVWHFLQDTRAVLSYFTRPVGGWVWTCRSFCILHSVVEREWNGEEGGISQSLLKMHAVWDVGDE
jgi:hypothetical protein